MLLKRIWLLALFSIVAACAAMAQNTSDYYTKREVMIPMRDGTHLYTAIYEPTDSHDRHPILMARTPYGCHPYGKEMENLFAPSLAHYAREGYIFVFQDVRGTTMSEGTYENVRPVALAKGQKANDVTDSYDTADWLLHHTRNNGSIGVHGNSYLGFYTLVAALSRHPAIKAVCPQAPVGDWMMGDDIHHNGALMLTDAWSFLSGFGRLRQGPAESMPPMAEYYTGDEYSFFLNTLPLGNLTRLLRDSIPFWHQFMQHPTYDNWWRARTPIPHYRNLCCAVMVTGGWFDAEDLYGTLHAYRQLSRTMHADSLFLIMGPWKHGGWNSKKNNGLGDITFSKENLNEVFRTAENTFFDHYLLDRPLPEQMPHAKVFFTGENQWRDLSRWPLGATTPKALYLTDGGSLSSHLPATGATPATYTSDPAHPVPYSANPWHHRKAQYMVADQRFASFRPDVLTYTTPALRESLTVAGPVKVKLWAKSSTTDADFIVKLIDVQPDSSSLAGYQMLVRFDLLRARFRNDMAHPSPLVPGKAEEMTLELNDVAHTFMPGHRLMVQVQSSCFPLVDLNPQKFVDIYRCTKADFQKADITILQDRAHPSRIILPLAARTQAR